MIEARAPDGISLQDVADQVGRAPAHVAAMMKQHTGRTVVAWITHARMAHARQLLSSSEENIHQIATQLGFASPSHFHRTFRRWHEMTPAQWRRAHRTAIG